MIHYYSLLGQNIVLDVYSGAVHVLDDAAFAVIEHFGQNFVMAEDCPAEVTDALRERFTPEIAAGAYAELRELVRGDTLYTPDIYADYAHGFEKRSVLKAMCLHIAHDCNLRCKYCFAGSESHNGAGSYSGARSMMSADIGRKAIDFVIERSGQRKNIEIDYFGGEPLVNFGAVREITEYALRRGAECGKRFRFTITTNGLLLDAAKMAFINEHMSNVVLSLDGTKAVNDAMRVRADGSGCYDAVVPKFLELAESRGQDNYYVRGTFTAFNLDFAKDVLHLADLGFEQTSVEPVVAPDSAPYALLPEHLPQIYAEYEKLAAEYVKRRREGRGFNFFHFMVDLAQGPCVIKRLSGCGSGHEYVAVTPEGDIYPCHQFVGKSEFRMGSVVDGSFDEGIKRTFQQSNVYTKPDCAECFAKFYCSGGCPANAYNINGDLDKPYAIACDMERKRVECAIAIAAALAEGK